jgi:hypothetical protein
MLVFEDRHGRRVGLQVLPWRAQLKSAACGGFPATWVHVGRQELVRIELTEVRPTRFPMDIEYHLGTSVIHSTVCRADIAVYMDAPWCPVPPTLTNPGDAFSVAVQDPGKHLLALWHG